MDLRMMLLFGCGHIRTEAELRKSFGAAVETPVACFHYGPSPNIIVEGRIER
jgi:hypothetical protein